MVILLNKNTYFPSTVLSILHLSHFIFTELHKGGIQITPKEGKKFWGVQKWKTSEVCVY